MFGSSPMKTKAPDASRSLRSPLVRFSSTTPVSLPLAPPTNSVTAVFVRTSILGCVSTFSCSSLLPARRSENSTTVTLSTNCVRNNPSSSPLLPPPITSSSRSPL